MIDDVLFLLFLNDIYNNVNKQQIPRGDKSGGFTVVRVDVYGRNAAAVIRAQIASHARSDGNQIEMEHDERRTGEIRDVGEPRENVEL
tara:strand:- start:853 stop:1116 length:264 start_codon:yes stop_codon:yes gene_type:complete